MLIFFWSGGQPITSVTRMFFTKAKRRTFYTAPKG